MHSLAISWWHILWCRSLRNLFLNPWTRSLAWSLPKYWSRLILWSVFCNGRTSYTHLSCIKKWGLYGPLFYVIMIPWLRRHCHVFPIQFGYACLHGCALTTTIGCWNLILVMWCCIWRCQKSNVLLRHWRPFWSKPKKKAGNRLTNSHLSSRSFYAILRVW